MLEINNLALGYGSRRLVTGGNASRPAGSLTALVGRNGSGKSTLLRALSGQGPYTGSITLDGVEINRMNPGELARKVSLVTTERVRIPRLTCRDLVAMGRAPYTDWLGRLSKQDYLIVDSALEATGMASWATRSLDTMSDGECQRVMVARALAQDTPVILLDEPTSFLDMPGRYRLVQLLQRLANDHSKCIIFSTHELDLALNMASDILLVDNLSLHTLSAASPSTRERISQAFDIPL